MPKSLRRIIRRGAGRRWSPGRVYPLLYAPGDVQTAKFLIENGGNEDLPADVLAGAAGR